MIIPQSLYKGVYVYLNMSLFKFAMAFVDLYGR